MQHFEIQKPAGSIRDMTPPDLNTTQIKKGRSNSKKSGKKFAAMKSSIMSSAALAISTAASSFTAGAARAVNGCYFPGCRKDINCNCKICLASINATLDLIPTGSFIRRAATPPPRPVMEPETPPLTPDHLIPTQSFSLTPPIESTVKSRRQIRGIPARKGEFRVLGHWKLMVFVGIFLFAAVNLRFLEGVIEGFGPSLSEEILEQFVEESGRKAVNLTARLRNLELKIGGVVDGDVLNCSSLNAVWKMKQVGRQILHWRCVIYQSMAEEVSVWGSPFRTSGLISTGFYSRSITLLLGRITEWSDGKLDAISRTGTGNSWILKRWITIGMQLGSNTWVVEYKRKALFQDPKFLPAALEVLRLRSIKLFKLVKQETGRLLTLGPFSYAFYHPEESDLLHPT